MKSKQDAGGAAAKTAPAVPEEDGMRNQFTFYASFYRSLRALPAARRPATAMAIIEYGLFGRVLTPVGEQSRGMLELIFPVLDSARKRAQAGRLGGRSRAEQQANAKQNAVDAEAKRRQSSGKPEAKRRQSPGEGEIEAEEEGEIEQDSERSLRALAERGSDAVLPELTPQTVRALQAVEQAVGPLTKTQRSEAARYAGRFGAGTVEEAARLGTQRGAKSWNYLRRMLDGGLSAPPQMQLRTHDEPLSALMKQAVNELIREEVGDDDED